LSITIGRIDVLTTGGTGPNGGRTLGAEVGVKNNPSELRFCWNGF
jgi:hypothetical protein